MMSLLTILLIIKLAMDKSKIAILSTVVNFELYGKSSLLFPAEIQKYVIDGTNGMHGLHSIKYMMRKLSGKGIEWLIMADEDVIFTDSSLVFSIIEEMNEQRISVCGIRDGGMISHRDKNPYVINTFFSILNFAEIETIWNEKEVLENQFVINDEFDDDLSQVKYSYSTTSIYEPYYCFYFWLRRKNIFFLFLNTTMADDGISNYVFFKEKEVLCHTWFARSYNVNEKHTKRINEILKKNQLRPALNLSNPIIFKSIFFALHQKISSYYRKIRHKLFK